MADTPYPAHIRLQWAYTFPGLTLAERGLLMAFVQHASAQDCTCYQGIDTMAADMGVNRTTIIRGIDRLIEKGALSKGKRGRSNLYTLQRVAQTPQVAKNATRCKSVINRWQKCSERLQKRTERVAQTPPQQVLTGNEQVLTAKSFVSHSQHGDQDEGQDEAPADLEDKNTRSATS